MKYPDSVNRYNHVTRRIFEKTIDRLESKIARLNEQQKRNVQRLKLIEQFLSESPHAAAWAAYLQVKNIQ